MRRIAVTVLTGACVAGALAVARADDKQEITALYTRYSAAMKARNVAGVMALITPDFHERLINGKELTGPQAEQALKAQFATVKQVRQFDVHPMSITLKGDHAVVLDSYSYDLTLVDQAGKFGPKGQKHTMGDTGLDRDVLVKTPHGWRVQAVVRWKQSPTLDGRSLYSMRPGGGGPPGGGRGPGGR